MKIDRVTARETLESIRGGLIVSCQALEDEPLHGPAFMVRMARAAQMGGGIGIRANSLEDCREIKREIHLPLIAIIKKTYADSEVCITPTLLEFRDLLAVGPEIIATDATARRRPGGVSLQEYVREAKRIFSGLLMADISTLEEALMAQELGFDIVSTTLSGYTSYSKGDPAPNLDLVRATCARLRIPVIAEGNVGTPEQAAECILLGAHAVVVGGAITRPQEITKKFVDRIREDNIGMEVVSHGG